MIKPTKSRPKKVIKKKISDISADLEGDISVIISMLEGFRDSFKDCKVVLSQEHEWDEPARIIAYATREEYDDEYEARILNEDDINRAKLTKQLAKIEADKAKIRKQAIKLGLIKE